MSRVQNEIDNTKLPKHDAITMDGNGRWAKEKGNIRLIGIPRPRWRTPLLRDAVQRLSLNPTATARQPYNHRPKPMRPAVKPRRC